MKKLFIISMILLLCSVSSAKVKGRWCSTKGFVDVTLIDVTFSEGNILITFQDGRWFRMATSYLSDTFEDMVLFKKGTLYHYLDENGDWDEKYKWVENKEIVEPTPNKKVIKPAIKKKRTPVKPQSSWSDISIKLPNKHAIVLVKYENELLTTAYLNDDNEWKLTTSKNRLFGGETITVIRHWRIIE